MIRINQVKVKADILSQKEVLLKKACDMLHIQESEIKNLSIVKQSIDARKKPDIYYSYIVDVELADRSGPKSSRNQESSKNQESSQSQENRKYEEKLIKRAKNPNIGLTEKVKYEFPNSGSEKLTFRPVIIGTGPAGLFCGYFLARAGFRPILLERGEDVDSRKKDVERFWKEGVLNIHSNVQFGEGGAGTFSDGKLNTLVKDKYGRNTAVLETFVKFGAKESILYEAKPHIGTDVLCDIVKRMREEIIRLGGEIRFESQVTALRFTSQKEEHLRVAQGMDELSVDAGMTRRLQGVVINGQEFLPCEQVVLAIGHSARDTFEELYAEQIPMEAKSFAVGLRVEHPQAMINKSQYGMEDAGNLGAAPYKVTAQTSVGRGVYSFCMCPGGYVVNASSEEGRLAVNGMSYSGRDGQNANSAVIVSVTPADFGSEHPLAGIAFQRRLEENAYRIGQGKIPVQRYGDFKRCVEERTMETGTMEERTTEAEAGKAEAGKTEENRSCSEASEFRPQNKGEFVYADVSRILPEECNLAFVEGMTRFGQLIPGFDRPDAYVSGVESRTSSPIRINRDDTLQSLSVKGLYPCGEGAGYAGGITSAAMDGIRVAEMIASQYALL